MRFSMTNRSVKFVNFPLTQTLSNSTRRLNPNNILFLFLLHGFRDDLQDLIF